MEFNDYPERFATDPDQIDAMREHAREIWRERWLIVEANVGGEPNMSPSEGTTLNEPSRFAIPETATNGHEVPRRSGPRGCSHGGPALSGYASCGNTMSSCASSVQSPRRCKSSERRTAAGADGASTQASESPYRTDHHPVMSASTPRLSTKRKRTLHRNGERSHGRGRSSACGPKERRREPEQEKNMSLTYPSREEAMQYRNELQEAVGAARRGDEPKRDALAWPAGLDRTLLRGLPLPTHTRNCLVRARLMEGDNALTVAEMQRIPEVGPTTVRNLLIGIDEFLDAYVETFEGRPGPAEVAAMRLAKEVQALTPTAAVIVDERMLKRPPTEYHALAMRLDMPSAQIRSRLVKGTTEIRDCAGAGASAHRDEAGSRPRAEPLRVRGQRANRRSTRQCVTGRRGRSEAQDEGGVSTCTGHADERRTGSPRTPKSSMT